MHERPIKESTGVSLDGLVFRNPVVIGVLGLFPVAGTGYTMQNAVAFSLMTPVMMLSMCALGGWMKIPVWIRPVAALVLSGAIRLPAAALTKRLMSQAFSVLSTYAVLIIDDSIIPSRANDYAPSHITLATLMDSLGCMAGFSAVIFLVTALWEIWGNIVRGAGEVYYAGAHSLVGFLLLGVIAALIQRTNAKWATAERKAK